MATCTKCWMEIATCGCGKPICGCGHTCAPPKKKK